MIRRPETYETRSAVTETAVSEVKSVLPPRGQRERRENEEIVANMTIRLLRRSELHAARRADIDRRRRLATDRAAGSEQRRRQLHKRVRVGECALHRPRQRARRVVPREDRVAHTLTP